MISRPLQVLQYLYYQGTFSSDLQSSASPPTSISSTIKVNSPQIILTAYHQSSASPPTSRVIMVFSSDYPLVSLKKLDFYIEEVIRMIYLALPAPPPHSSHCYTDCLCLTVGLLQGESKKHNCHVSLETIGPVSICHHGRGHHVSSYVIMSHVSSDLRVPWVDWAGPLATRHALTPEG